MASTNQNHQIHIPRPGGPVSSGDMGDRSVEEHSRYVDLSVQSIHFEQERRRREDTNRAEIRKLGGLTPACVDCGEEILPKRLEVFPGAERCTRCEETYELAVSARRRRV